MLLSDNVHLINISAASTFVKLSFFPFHLECSVTKKVSEYLTQSSHSLRFSGESLTQNKEFFISGNKERGQSSQTNQDPGAWFNLDLTPPTLQVSKPTHLHPLDRVFYSEGLLNNSLLPFHHVNHLLSRGLS